MRFQGVAVILLSMISLACAGVAQADKSRIAPEVHAKSSSVGPIAASLAARGTARVIVSVEPGGQTRSATEAAVRDPRSRDAAKARIAAAIDSVIAGHGLAATARARGQPAITRLTTVPAFAVTVTAAELEGLARDARVLAIDHDRPVHKHLDVTLPLIGVPAVFSAGGTGIGRTVAVIDDGVQRSHTFIGTARLISGREACFLDTNDCPNGTNQQIGTNAGAAAAGAHHGTHVAGIVLGNRASGSPLKGVAPAARLVPINIFGPNDTTSFSTIQRAFEHVEDLVLLNSGSNPLRIAAINMSVGGNQAAGHCDTDPVMAMLKPVVENLRMRNVLAAVSAGNDYSSSSMGYPACLSSMLSVAATSRAGVVASYTSISATTDLFAPGGELGGDCVVSSIPTNTFAAMCGTSMAAPHVAGAIAVLKQKVPGASACRIEDALKATGLPTTDTRAGGTVTKPRLRLEEALARLQTPVPPANNSFANAIVIPSAFSQLSLSGSNIGATLEPGEPHHVVSTSARSVWWRWTPDTSGKVTIDTIGTGFETVLAVYRGATAVTNLGPPVAQNDDMGLAQTASRVAFQATAGQTYHIVVAGKTGSQECAISLNLTRPPANDNFAQALAVPVTATAEIGIGASNVGATKEAGEPDHHDNAEHTSSVWFKFRAPVSGPITIDTEGSVLSDTVLAVYTGSSVSALTEVASDDDSGSGLLSRVTFNMVAGTSYKVAVVGYGGATGRFRLWFSPAGSQSTDRTRAAALELAD